MNQLLDIVSATIGNTTVPRPKRTDRLASIGATFFAAGYPTLRNSEISLLGAMPFGVFNVLAIRRCEKAGNTYVDADSPTSHFEWLRLYFTDEASVPLPCLASDAYCLDLAFNGPVPAYCHAPDSRQLQSLAIQPETVAILFEPKRVKTILTTEPRIARFFTRLDPAKEGLKRFIEIRYHNLQDVTMYLSRVGIFFAVDFHICQLLKLADATPLAFPGVLTLGKTSIVPVAARLKRLAEQALLALARIQPVLVG